MPSGLGLGEIGTFTGFQFKKGKWFWFYSCIISSDFESWLCGCSVHLISAAFATGGLIKQDHQSGGGSEGKQSCLYLQYEWRRERAGPGINSCV